MKLVTAMLMWCFLSGCLSWTPGYQDPVSASLDAAAKKNIVGITQQISSLRLVADSREKVEELIGLYGKILSLDPQNYSALVAQSNLKLLIGAAYAKSTGESADVFVEALKLNERAMYTNPEFKRRVDLGETTWDAAPALTIREIDAAGFWATAVFYYFRHVFGPVSRTMNAKWIMRAKLVMEQMDKLDPAWGSGGLYFTWGLYYKALPEYAGGSKPKAEEFFKKSIAAGPKMIRNRWIRAKYYYPVINNRRGFDEDIAWILQQDPKKDGGDVPWNYFFQRDAREMQADKSLW
jgi:tetratricopeptide (TPR) repeat protein